MPRFERRCGMVGANVVDGSRGGGAGAGAPVGTRGGEPGLLEADHVRVFLLDVREERALVEVLAQSPEKELAFQVTNEAGSERRGRRGPLRA